MEQIISLWVFSCNLYQQTNVQKHCLFLQDEFCADIPLLLFCCWAGHYYHPLSSGQVMQVRGHAQLWREQCITPLRQIRREMKTQNRDSLGSPETTSSWLAIREQVKALELSGEKALLETLERQMDADCLSNEPRCQHMIRNMMQCLLPSAPNLFKDAQSVAAIADIVHAVAPQIQYDVVFKMITTETQDEC